MAKMLDENALIFLWAKIKSVFALKNHTHTEHYTKEEINALIQNLQNQINTKQNKIETWGNLKGE